MPYKTIADLPAGTAMLPKHAKEIYLAAFKSAWEQYKDLGDNRESRAHQVAWAAVKTKFEKKNGKWRAIPEKTAEAFVPMPMQVLCLAEADAVLAEVAEDEWLQDEEVAEADTPQHRLIATLIEVGDNKAGTRRYTSEFLQRCVAEGRFTGSYGYANHPSLAESRERPERDLRYLAARTGEAFYDPSGGKLKRGAVKAPLVWLAEEHPSSMGGLMSALFCDPVVRQRSGLSIYYNGPVQVEEAEVPGNKRRLQIPVALGDNRKFDVDIVTAPGAGGGLPMLEAERQEPQQEVELPMTYEEWKEQFPEFVSQLLTEKDDVGGPGAAVSEAVYLASRGTQPKCRDCGFDIEKCPKCGKSSVMYDETAARPMGEADVPDQATASEAAPEVEAATAAPDAAEPAATPEPAAEVVPPETEVPAPVVAPVPEPPAGALGTPAVTEVVVPKAVDAAIAELREEVARLKSGRMLEDALATEPVDATIREAVRRQLAEEVFASPEAFRAKFAATVAGMKEVASQAAGPRVADLGGAPPAEGQSGKVTLRDLTKKKEA